MFSMAFLREYSISNYIDVLRPFPGLLSQFSSQVSKEDAEISVLGAFRDSTFNMDTCVTAVRHVPSTNINISYVARNK